MILEVTGDALEGYGKASVVGMGGELEHAQTLTHSLWFGNQYRDAVKAKTYLAFSNTRGAAGCPLIIPLMDKQDGGAARTTKPFILMCPTHRPKMRL